MSRGLNVIVLNGNIGQDPELKHVGQKNTPLLVFTLAVTTWQGEEKTDWFRCQVWGERAEKLSEFLAKGMNVTVHGSMHIENVKNQKGEWNTYTKVDVRDLILAPKGDGGSSKPKKKAKAGTAPDDELPF